MSVVRPARRSWDRWRGLGGAWFAPTGICPPTDPERPLSEGETRVIVVIGIDAHKRSHTSCWSRAGTAARPSGRRGRPQRIDASWSRGAEPSLSGRALPPDLLAAPACREPAGRKRRQILDVPPDSPDSGPGDQLDRSLEGVAPVVRWASCRPARRPARSVCERLCASIPNHHDDPCLSFAGGARSGSVGGHIPVGATPRSSKPRQPVPRSPRGRTTDISHEGN